jgi:hypothetical protein
MKSSELLVEILLFSEGIARKDKFSSVTSSVNFLCIKKKKRRFKGRGTDITNKGTTSSELLVEMSLYSEGTAL